MTLLRTGRDIFDVYSSAMKTNHITGMNDRRNFLVGLLKGSLFLSVLPFPTIGKNKPLSGQGDPTQCDFAPCGEYTKDHSFIYHDGWYHLFSISGTAGYYHGYNGNEETISWSISKDLVNWEFRGHVLHATQRKGAFDQHEIWAPFCFKAMDRFFMFYTGVVHPYRPMEYKKLGHDHPWVSKGHKETQGVAVSDDLTSWEKIADFEKGLGIPGRDSNIAFDERNGRYLLYSTIGTHEVHVSESTDMVTWRPIGKCAEFPKIDPNQDLGATTNRFNSFLNASESLHVMEHPLSRKWIMMGNWSYIISDDPLRFDMQNAALYDRSYNGSSVDLGFACEMVAYHGKWYRSGNFGKRDYWKLGFTEIEWVVDGAFKVSKPSVHWKP